MYSLRTLSCEEDMTLPNDQLSMTSCKWKPLLLREKYIECLAATISEKNFRSDFELVGMHRIKEVAASNSSALPLEAQE